MLPAKSEAMNPINAIRYRIGLRLLDYTLSILPIRDTVRIGVVRGLKEQRDYDRYAAYCQLQGAESLSFETWREVRQWMQVKVASAN